MFNMESSVPYMASSLSRHAVFVRVGACLSLRVRVQSTCREVAGHCAAGAGSGHRNAALQSCSRSGSNPTPAPGHGHTFSHCTLRGGIAPLWQGWQGCRHLFFCLGDRFFGPFLLFFCLYVTGFCLLCNLFLKYVKPQVWQLPYLPYWCRRLWTSRPAGKTVHLHIYNLHTFVKIKEFYTMNTNPFLSPLSEEMLGPDAGCSGGDI